MACRPARSVRAVVAAEFPDLDTCGCAIQETLMMRWARLPFEERPAAMA